VRHRDQEAADAGAPLHRHRFVATDDRPGVTLDEQLFDHEQDTPNSSRNFPAIRLDNSLWLRRLAKPVDATSSLP